MIGDDCDSTCASVLARNFLYFYRVEGVGWGEGCLAVGDMLLQEK